VAATGGDWAAQTADSIERVVDSVRSKTSEPVERLGRILVYGLLAAIVGTAALVLLAILLVRVLDVAIPGEVWPAHLITGGIFTLLGLFLWRKRTAKTVKV
jgi:tetrahydromethanopterin S-methyltransferase subunit F